MNILKCFAKKETDDNDMKDTVCEKTYPSIGNLMFEGDAFPEIEETESPTPQIEDKHIAFREIIDICGVKYILSSQHMHDVCRAYGLGTNCETKLYAIDYRPNESKHVNRVKYVTRIYRYHFIDRLFKTEAGNYVLQIICSDGTYEFNPMTQCDVQKFIEGIEDYSKSVEHFGDRQYIVDSTMATEVREIRSNEIFVSHEIVDKELYDNIIPLY